MDGGRVTSVTPVVESRSTAIVEALRGRILRALQAGVLSPGDRLPSARELVDEFHVDHRLIAAAYRRLADQGLVSMRERAGVHVASSAASRAGMPALPMRWFVDVLTEAFALEIPATDLHEWLRRSIETLRLRLVVISTTPEQVAGLVRELRDDFGVVADGFAGAGLPLAPPYPPAVHRADLIVVTKTQVHVADRIGAALEKRVLAIEVQPELVRGEWALLLKGTLWAVVASSEFGALLQDFLADVPGIANLRILIAGHDDLSTIPDGAPTYVSHSVRAQEVTGAIRGRILPPARAMTTDSARALFDFIVRTNVESMAALRT